MVLEARLANLLPASYRLRPQINPVWRVNGKPAALESRGSTALAKIPRDIPGRFETSIEIAGETAWAGVNWILDRRWDPAL